MPVEFLTDEQAESYGTFTQEPTRPELERVFFLDDEDRRLIGKRRGDHSRLGFSLQVCTVRYVGLFLQDPLAVPWPVVEYLMHGEFKLNMNTRLTLGSASPLPSQ